MPSRSKLKLTQRIKERAAQIILQELRDPRMGFVTITRVDLSKDFTHCEIFYSVMGSPGEISRTHHALADATGFIQRRIAEGLRTRSAPRIKLTFDESVEGSMQISSLLKKIADERADTADPPGDDPAN